MYNRNTMEHSLHARYLNSQDHLIISLNEQIQAMTPLKQSYSALERYHSKLRHDYESLLQEHDHLVSSSSAKIQELLQIGEELDAKRNKFVQELRSLDNQKARLVLQRKSLMSACETLASKYNLENQQAVIARERAREISDSIKKTEQGINTYRKIIADLETQIKLKVSDNAQIQNQIQRKIDFNRKLTLRIEETENDIKNVSLENEKICQQNRGLDKNQQALQQKIREQVRRNRDLNERNLLKREQLANLHHQKQYYLRLLESESLIKEDLDISETKLKGLLERKIKECERVAKENTEFEQKIRNQEQNFKKSRVYKDALTEHLSELIRANSALLETMRKSCKQDEKAHLILNKKLDGLQIAAIRTSELQTSPPYKKTVILRQKTNEMSSVGLGIKDKSGSTWINELSDLENRV